METSRLSWRMRRRSEGLMDSAYSYFGFLQSGPHTCVDVPLTPAEGVCLIMIQDSKALFVTSKCRRRSETTLVAMLMRDKQPKQHLQQRKKRQEQQKPCEITV